MPDTLRRRPRIITKKKAVPKKPPKEPRTRQVAYDDCGECAIAIRGEIYLPAKLTPALIKDICKLIEDGLPLDGVCDYLLITPSNFFEWRRRGEEFLISGNNEPKANAICGHFVMAMRKAMASFRLKMTKSWLTADKEVDDWKRYSTMLASRDRRTYARQSVESEQGESFNPDESFL